MFLPNYNMKNGPPIYGYETTPPVNAGYHSTPAGKVTGPIQFPLTPTFSVMETLNKLLSRSRIVKPYGF